MQIFEFLILFAFLVFASCGWGAICCERTKLPVIFLFMFGFAVLAGFSYLVFFLFLLDAELGRAVISVVGLVSLGITMRFFSKPETRKIFLKTDVWLPVLLFFLYGSSCLVVLVWHGGDTNRFLTSQMPDDNILPAVLANRLWEGGPTKTFWGMTVIQVSPFVGDWLSSDRPPLQAAIYLACRPFEFLRFNSNDIYVIVSTLCQAVWVPATYLLVRQLRFSRYAIAYTLIWFAGCGFFLFHTIYTWPKLLSAALFLTGFAVLLNCEKKLPGKNPAALLMLGLLWSLALLAHGGILFSFLAIPFLPAAWRVAKGAPVPVLGALAVFVLMSLPWAIYQKYYDPPANRLIKMHLAGVDDVDPRGTFETLRDSYGSLTFSQWCQNRLGNVEMSLGVDNPDKWHVFQSASGMRQYLNCEVFFRLSAVLGFLNVGFVLLAVTWFWKKLCGPLDDTGWGELLVMNIGCYLIWIVMMFHPDGAIVHQGSFAMVIFFMLIAIVGVMKLPVWMSGALLVLEWTQFVFADLFSFYMAGPVNVPGFVYPLTYGALIALFVISLWAFLPRTTSD